MMLRSDVEREEGEEREKSRRVKEEDGRGGRGLVVVVVRWCSM